MLNTYINDNSNVPYPFYGLTELPFPNNYILGLSIAILKGTSSYNIYDIKLPLHVATLSISNGILSISICDANNTLLCIASTGDSPSIYSNGLTYNGINIIQVDLFTGNIPTDITESYYGVFYIDPSCITVTPSNVYGVHKQSIINGNTYALEDTLTLHVEEGLALNEESDSYTLTIDDELEDEQFIENRSASSSEMVQSINGVAVNTGNLTDVAVLQIDVKHAIINDANKDELMLTTDTDTGRTNIAVLTVNGTKWFPNCYDKDKDEA